MVFGEAPQSRVGRAKKKLDAAARRARAEKIRDQIGVLMEELKVLDVADVPKVKLPALHASDTGRIDAQKMAAFMGVALKPLSEGLGLNYTTVHRTPTAIRAQPALREVKHSLDILHEFFGAPEAIRAWLNTPHPDLGGSTALEMILSGKAFAVERILNNAWHGVPL